MIQSPRREQSFPGRRDRRAENARTIASTQLSSMAEVGMVNQLTTLNAPEGERR
jgi:hypothetical protein